MYTSGNQQMYDHRQRNGHVTNNIGKQNERRNTGQYHNRAYEVENISYRTDHPNRQSHGNYRSHDENRVQQLNGYSNNKYNGEAIHNNYKPTATGVSYNTGPPQVEYYHQDEMTFQSSKRRMKYTLLGFASFFILAAIATSVVSILMTPWWKQESSLGSIEVGLWKSCLKLAGTSNFECRDYTKELTSLHGSPYGSIDVIQYCMIAGSAACGAAFIMVAIGVLARKTKAFRCFVFLTLCLTLSGVALFLVSIGFSLEVDESVKLIPKWITAAPTAVKLKTGLMFILAGVAGGTSAIAMILIAVLLFISDDPIDYEDEQSGHIRSDSWHYDSRIEREISKRNKKPGDYIQRPYMLGTSLERTNNGFHRPEFYEFSHYGSAGAQQEPPPPPQYRSVEHGVSHQQDILDANLQDRDDYYNRYRRRKEPYQSYNDFGRDDDEVENKNEVDVGNKRPHVTQQLVAGHAKYQPNGPHIGNVSNHPDYSETLPQPPISVGGRSNMSKSQSYDQYEMYFNSPY